MFLAFAYRRHSDGANDSFGILANAPGSVCPDWRELGSKYDTIAGRLD